MMLGPNSIASNESKTRLPRPHRIACIVTLRSWMSADALGAKGEGVQIVAANTHEASCQ